MQLDQVASTPRYTFLHDNPQDVLAIWIMRKKDQQESELLTHNLNRSLIEKVERALEQEESDFSLFAPPERVDAQARQRTSELIDSVAYLQRSNQQLANAKETAEQQNSSKTRFLAAASHDVLQPLNAALLLMATLSSVQTGDEGKRLCRQVERSLETMDTLLRNLLYMSRLDAGDVKPYFQAVSLDELFDSIESDFEPIAKIRNLELRIRRSGLYVWSDPTMLRRSVQNIVANALRYTKQGGALVVAGKRDEQVHIRIADTGIGIDNKRFKEIFVEFQRCTQAHEGIDRSSAGMGLGLAIVERMMKTLNHSLTLNSRVGSGSCFNLILPLTQAPQQTKQPERIGLKNQNKHTGGELQNVRVLLIENDLPALQAMEALLAQWGCELRLASSAREAMSAVSREQSWLPHVIVADQHLDNNERGTSVVRVLRQLTGRQIPTIIVTAAPSAQLWKMADQGQIEVMQKPVKPAQLRALLTHLQTRSIELTA